MKGLSKFLSVVLAVASARVATAKPSAGCGNPPTLAAGNHSVTVNGTSRWYLLKYVPSIHDPQESTATVVIVTVC